MPNSVKYFFLCKKYFKSIIFVSYLQTDEVDTQKSDKNNDYLKTKKKKLCRPGTVASNFCNFVDSVPMCLLPLVLIPTYIFNLESYLVNRKTPGSYILRIIWSTVPISMRSKYIRVNGTYYGYYINCAAVEGRK